MTCFHWNPFLVTRVRVSHPIQVFRFIVVVQSIPGHYSSIQYTVQQQYNPSQDIIVLYSTQYTVHSIVVVQSIPGHYSPIQYTVHSIVQQQYNTSQDIIVLYSTQYRVQYSSSTIHPRTLKSYIVHSTQYSIVVVQYIPGHYSPIQHMVHCIAQKQYNPSQDIIILHCTQYCLVVA